MYLSRPVGDAPTIELAGRDDATNAMTFIELSPVQAMQVAAMLGMAAAAAVTRGEALRALNAS